jgi:TonB family protein
MELMRNIAVSILVFLFASFAYAFGQDESACPQRTVINNGVCVDKNGKDCSKREAHSRICFDPDPQYTEDAANAGIKGTIRLSATIDTNGCAKDIKVLTSLGHGLDESSVSALQRWRFRKPSKPTPINIEYNFDPKFSSRNALTAATCEELTAPVSNKKQ